MGHLHLPPHGHRPDSPAYHETERVEKLDPAAAQGEYALRVSTVGGRPERFVFEHARLRVGRARDCDLLVEHACMSREQFVIERSVGVGGEARFRIVPNEAATNPTYVNEHPAVEGALHPGDLIAVGELRLVLERAAPRGKAGKAAPRAAWEKDEAPKGLSFGAEAARQAKPPVPPARMALLAAVVLMTAVVGYLFLFSEDDESGAEVAAAQTPLFGRMPEPTCANPLECDAKAHEAYERGRKLVATSGADPGNLYRATLDFARARRYREQSGRPLGDIADVEARLERTRRDAEAAFDDARFALKRAIAAADTRRAAAEAALLGRMVPDEAHPYRVKLDAYRRNLPAPRKKSAAEAVGEKDP